MKTIKGYNIKSSKYIVICVDQWRSMSVYSYYMYMLLYCGMYIFKQSWKTNALKHLTFNTKPLHKNVKTLICQWCENKCAIFKFFLTSFNTAFLGSKFNFVLIVDFKDWRSWERYFTKIGSSRWSNSTPLVVC